MFFSTVTDVSDVAILPVRMEIITIPVNVHIMPKIRAVRDLGARSPYRSNTIKQKYLIVLDTLYKTAYQYTTFCSAVTKTRSSLNGRRARRCPNEIFLLAPETIDPNNFPIPKKNSNYRL